MLILFICQCQCRGDGDRIPCMYTHRVKIFNRTDDDAVVCTITDHFHLVLFPAQQRLFDENLRDRGGFQSPLDDLLVLIHIVGDTGTATGEGVGGTDDEGETNLFGGLKCFVHIVGIAGDGQIHTDLDHSLLEGLSVFAFLDCFRIGSEELDAF